MSITLDLSAILNTYVLGDLLADDLPTIAMRAIDAGYDSPSLFQLAASEGYDSQYLQNLFLKVLDELGVSLPAPNEAALLTARSIADDVLNGNFAPYDGAKQIWNRIYTRFPELTQLRPFVGLASEYEDDEKHRGEYERMIIDECKGLVRGPTG